MTASRLVPRVLALLLTSLGAAAPVQAAPADDDWSLTHEASDPTLVGQRFAKLQRNPFDRGQWRALERAIGREALGRRIESARARAPGSFALAVLSARFQLASGKPREAAATLAAIESKAGRSASQVFALRVDALEASGELTAAVAALRERATGTRGKPQAALLERALGLAERAGMHAEAIAIAKQRVAVDGSVAQQLRLARLAARGNDGVLADEAFAAAEAIAKPAQRDEIALERARVRLDAGDGEAAAAIVWSLLDDPGRGSAAARLPRWDLLVDAHRRAGRAESLVAALRSWLEAHPGEAAAWRTLATAQELAGLDPQEARRRALALDPRDEDSQGALIDGLSERGDVDGAIAEYRRFAGRHRNDVERGLALAGSLMQGPHRDKGLALAAEIEARVGKRAQALSSLLEFYNLCDEPDLALAVARRLVKLAPRSAEAHLALGEQLFQMGHVPEALAQWATLPKLVRPTHRGHARHAEVLGEHGLVSDAIAALKVAMKLAPDEPAYLRLRAVFAEEQRRTPEALGLWQEVRARAKGPEHRLLREEARTRVVELLVESALPGRMERMLAIESEARIAFERGEPLADAVEAGLLLAELHTRRELYSAAVAVHRQLVKLQPGDAERLSDLASAQRRAGQPGDAIATIEALLELDPSRKDELMAELSELAFEAGDDERALAAAHAAATGARQVDALVRLGELHERRGDLDAAAAAYDESIQAAPDDLRGYLRLADLEITRTHAAKARELLMTAFEKGGAADLMREVGRRILDLAEADGDAVAVLAAAARRAGKHPNAEEPREFLLAALDRVPVAARTRWLGGSESEARAASLRAPLLAAIERGPISVRARAAEHLGGLRLPDTALPLLRAASSMNAPRDATPTVRDAYERARVTTLRAAAELSDPDATDAWVRILAADESSQAARHVAAWGLLGTPGEPPAALAEALAQGFDPVLASLACVHVALSAPASLASVTHRRIATAARDGRAPEVRHACALAEAVLARDDELDGLAAQLGATDPTLAAIAAWRLGRVARGATAEAQSLPALFSALLGPPGLRRDAAAAALAQRLGEREPAALDRPAVPRTPRPWATSFARWLVGHLAPRFEPVSAAAIGRHADALRDAIAANAAGTRAERDALAQARHACA
ncbi:MAG: tetratricopeptide repeat protein, partial [Nannocystaceae bacterium]|nr:tetratricopeptide repeat protein [Nannocystaceae bacterium]